MPRDETHQTSQHPKTTQPCPVCGHPIGICAGTKDAICTNCGFKDPCCE